MFFFSFGENWCLNFTLNFFIFIIGLSVILLFVLWVFSEICYFFRLRKEKKSALLILKTDKNVICCIDKGLYDYVKRYRKNNFRKEDSVV